MGLTEQPARPATATGSERHEASPHEPRVGATRVAAYEAFRYRDYRLLWLGSLFTTIANWVQITTLGWLAYSMTGSGATLGAAMAMRFAPTLFLTR